MWNVFLLTKFYQAIVGEQKSYLDFLRIPPSSSTEIDCFSVMLTLILLTIQQLRRFCECLFVASFSGEMHVAHYALGLMYYFMANLTVAVEIPNSISTGNQLIVLDNWNTQYYNRGCTCTSTYFFI